MFYIIEADTPFLLLLKDLDIHSFYFNNLTNQLINKDISISLLIVYRLSYPFLLQRSILSSFTITISRTDLVKGLLTESQLYQLYQRFGYPLVQQLQVILTCIDQEFDQYTIEYLSKYYYYYQKHGRSLGCFRFTIKDNTEFNYTILVDIFYIDSKPVLYIIDETT